jgi:hypothetical protein
MDTFRICNGQKRRCFANVFCTDNHKNNHIWTEEKYTQNIVWKVSAEEIVRQA